jgi:YD repeat-containing protein
MDAITHTEIKTNPRILYYSPPGEIIFNNPDQLISTDSTVNANDSSYTYDANGSTISVTTSAGTKKYVWDLRNRMIGYDANGDGDTLDNGDINYTYDQAGNRVSRTAMGDGAAYYLIDALNPTG